VAETVVSSLRTFGSPKHPVEKIEMIPSGGGVFDVFADGELVFSKKQVGRHADPMEIVDLLKKRLQAGK
jgi:selenoprotein W-related protein